MFNIQGAELSSEVIDFFQSYSWPGNIRELKNICEYIVNVIDERERVILLKHLPQKLFKPLLLRENKTLAELEKEAIENLIKKYGTSSKGKEKIAKVLDIGIATLYRKFKLYDL